MTTLVSRDRWLRRPLLYARALIVVALALAAFGLIAANARAAAPAPGLREALLAAGVTPEDADAAQAAATGQTAAPSQTAATEQTAASGATATQEQPTNVVVSIRINSPGDNGPISQTNVTAAVSGASNAAATTQTGGPADAAGAPSQAASTGQQAAATASATQDEAGNLVVVVRLNSPGDNGAVTQSNVAGAAANSGNASSTTQGAAPAQAAAPAEPTRTAPQQQAHVPTVTSAKPRTTRRRPARRAAPVAPRQRAAAPVTRAVAPVTAPPTSHAASAPPTTAAGTAGKAAHVAGAHARKHVRAGGSARTRSTARTTSTARTAIHPSLKSFAGSAADALGAIGRRPYGASNPEPTDVSSAVVFTLLALLGVVAAFLVWPELSSWLRLAQPRNRLRG